MDKITRKESERLLNLEKTIHERIIGQHAAVTAVAKALRRARVGLKSPKRPIASFLFCGPTGVGKTELTKALAFSLFGSDDSMVRIDMSEYMEKHTVAKLIGAPPGYIGFNEGGYLTESVRSKPYTVILLDEIEKAHPDIFNIMLQVLDDGRLTDSKGRTIDFTNTLVIMTSNVGSSIIERLENKTKESSEAVKKAQYDLMSRLVQGELKHYFRPEFLNRLDETIVFRQLSKMDMTKILSILAGQIFSRLNKKQVKVDLTKNFKDNLIKEGFDPSFGARPLRRAISRLVEDKLAEALLSGVVSPGDEVVLDYVNKGVTFKINGKKV